MWIQVLRWHCPYKWCLTTTQKIRKWMGSWWRRWCASWRLILGVLSEAQESSLAWEDEGRKLGRDGAEHWVQSSEEPFERNGQSSSWVPMAYGTGSVLHWVPVKSLAERKIWCDFGDILTNAPLDSVNHKHIVSTSRSSLPSTLLLSVSSCQSPL